LSWTTAHPFVGADRSSFLAYGRGRSYGDSCLNGGGVLVPTDRLDRFISFDDATGTLRCEAGVTLGEILELAVPRGWFLPVVPGTKHVTVGGAIANDVHGKNHHRAGTFGAHVRSLTLLRSSGERLECSSSSNAELFRATIGGLGLTGIVVSAAIALRRVGGPWIDQETVPFGSLDEFFDLSAASEPDHEFTVAWVDCVARGARLGRGLFHRGNHAREEGAQVARARARLRVPVDLPSRALNRWTVGLFNSLYRRRAQRERRRVVHYDPFFFPLDGVLEWNRLYGRAGLIQFQCVVPHARARPELRRILQRIADDGSASFLAVLKVFGDVASPGMLSFPRPGVTLALDFANRGERTLALVRELTAIARDAGGSFYPAKDACMGREDMRASYPSLDAFGRYVDPAFSSSFWRRAGLQRAS
jgi:FAD/FMN-containing dehydrogenase